MMLNQSIPLVVILGPTATGKTALAIDLAEEFAGEIICADSRTIYAGMDIGTAKPTAEERSRVPHHLLDVVEPGERLSVAEFKRLAEQAAQEIAGRGHVPLLVGGSGLYIDSVIFDYQFPPAADLNRRAELEVLSLEELVHQLQVLDPEGWETVDISNPRRVIRAIETAGVGKTKRVSVRPNTLVLGLNVSKEVAQERIEQRVEKMLDEGFIDEVHRIGTTYGWSHEALTGIGYRAFKDVVLGTKPLEVGKAEFVRGDMQLRRRQLTWFKRNAEIQWIEAGDARELVAKFLSKV